MFSASSTKVPLVILATSSPELARNRGQLQTLSRPEGAKVGLLVDGTKEESNKDGADEAGTGG